MSSISAAGWTLCWRVATPPIPQVQARQVPACSPLRRLDACSASACTAAVLTLMSLRKSNGTQRQSRLMCKAQKAVPPAVLERRRARQRLREEASAKPAGAEQTGLSTETVSLPPMPAVPSTIPRLRHPANGQALQEEAASLPPMPAVPSTVPTLRHPANGQALQEESREEVTDDAARLEREAVIQRQEAVIQRLREVRERKKRPKVQAAAEEGAKSLSSSGQSPASPSSASPPLLEGKVPLDRLQVGQQLRGIVKAVGLSHATLEVGAECEAILHVTKMSSKNAKNARELVYEGQEVDVWVSGIRSSKWDTEAKLEVTMLDSEALSVDVSAFRSVPKDTWLSATVDRIEKFGFFVKVPAPGGSGSPVQGFVHVSEIRDGYVESPEEEVQLGQEVRVRLVRVDSKFGRLRASMKAPKVVEEK